MLGRYKLTVSEAILKQLEEAPLAWKQLKKKTLQRCNIIAMSPKSRHQPFCKQQACTEDIEIRLYGTSFVEKVFLGQIIALGLKGSPGVQV